MLKTLHKAFKRVLLEEDGPTAVEYAVILALIIGACMSAFQALAAATMSSFDTSSNAIESALN